MKKRYVLLYKLSILFFSLVFVCQSGMIQAQEMIGLSQAVEMARKQSLSYKVAVNSLQSSTWNYKNYLASKRPILYLDGTIPNYARSINKITLPSGEDSFVSQNQAYSSLYLNLQQQITATGGTLAIGTSLNRIDVFGDNRSVNYSSVPLSISYTQNTIGYNEFRWQKKTEPLRLQLADKTFVSNMEDIGLSTITIYFSALNAFARKELSKQNLANADTLLRIANERYKLGTVGHSDLLQLRLNVLTARKQLTQDSVDFVLARQQFSSFLSFKNDAEWQIAPPESIHFFPVNYVQALEKAQGNSKEVLQFRLDRLEAEQDLDKTKSENKLKFNIYGNLGFSNVSPTIPGLFNNLENQQNLSIGFSLPILDWGNAKTKRLRAEANLSMVESQIEQKKLEFEQEIALQVARWNLQEEQLAIAEESRQIAAQNYELEKERFLRGTVSINDLNVAQASKDNAIIAYYEVLKTYWELYYTIRKLTLYDFEKNTGITYMIDNKE